MPTECNPKLFEFASGHLQKPHFQALLPLMSMIWQ
jgi:hypothetical protein